MTSPATQTGSQAPWRQMIPVDKIHPSPDNPRTEPGDLEELEASIREQGLQQPILVRPYQKEGSGHYVIADGWRRYLAMREWVTEIPAIIKPPRQGENVHVSTLLTGLVTSVHQRPLNPMERAWAYGRLRDEFGMNATQIAQSTGQHVTTVTNSLILLELAPSSQKMVANGKLQVGEAVRLLRRQRKAERKRRKPGSSGRAGAVWEPDWFTRNHALAVPAMTRCDRIGHNMRRRIGRSGKYTGACGQCWEVVVTAEAEAKVLDRVADEIRASDPARAARWRQEAETYRSS